SFEVLVLPLFILFGSVIAASPSSSDIYEAFHRWLSRIPGGLVVANIFSCGMFAALCGSSPAVVAAVGKVGVPEMRRRGVGARLATGAVTAGGTLGILIPPSVPLLIYGIVTEQSIGRLFLAGVVPGILLMLIFAAYVIITEFFRKDRVVLVEHYTLRQKVEPVPRVLPFIAMILCILYALYGGVATPSEIAAVAALAACLLVLLIYRIWSLPMWMEAFLGAIRESSMVLLIVAGSAVFSYTLSVLYIPQSMAEWVAELDLSRWVLMAAINIATLVLGCFLPPVAIILMIMPILAPMLIQNAFDLIWFGIVLTINMEIGLITPPVGVNLYVMKGVAPDVSLTNIFMGALPFVILMLLMIVLLCIFPGIVTWLPDYMMGPATH
ncbi:MAG: TRAP transporter large permease, partial [Hyphomicrobium sp.]|nr:TRAP transporter large permease [Hyphomicrobium sp.]